MALEITCKCGNGVAFVPDEDSRAPLRAECEGCGRVWKLSVDQVLPPKAQVAEAPSGRRW